MKRFHASHASASRLLICKLRIRVMKVVRGSCFITLQMNGGQLSLIRNGMVLGNA